MCFYICESLWPHLKMFILFPMSISNVANTDTALRKQKKSSLKLYEFSFFLLNKTLQQHLPLKIQNPATSQYDQFRNSLSWFRWNMEGWSQTHGLNPLLFFHRCRRQKAAAPLWNKQTHLIDCHDLFDHILHICWFWSNPKQDMHFQILLFVENVPVRNTKTRFTNVIKQTEN